MPPRRQVPKSLRNCAEVIELGDDAISYCLVRRDPPPPETIDTLHFPIRPEIRPPPRARGASLHSAGRLPRPLVAPLRSKSLGARAGRSRSRAHDRDRSRHRDDTAAPRRSPRRSTAPRRWWNRSDLVGQEELPEATRIPRFQPALDARSPSLIPCTQSCKRSRLKKFFSPGRACCSDCLKVRRPPPPPQTRAATNR